ncbi:MAG: hypothetical protein ACKVOK_11045 [Flavobacteriales bacterium]
METHSEIRELATAKCIIRYDPSRHLMFFSFLPETMHELHDAMNALKLARKLVPQGKVPLLLDSTGIKGYTSEVRTFFADEEATSLIQCMAVVVNTLSIKLAGNFFIYVTKPSYPTKLFSTEKAGVDWLMAYSASHLS